MTSDKDPESDLEALLEVRNPLLFFLRLPFVACDEIFRWLVDTASKSGARTNVSPLRPPFNAEYLLYLLLRREDRDIVIGDLLEGYGEVLRRFNKRRADIWFYWQVASSLFPLLRRALFRIGVLVWLGQVLRRIVS